ncbi:proenkephalin b [Amia ocellicauda]|uniref:Proenkephalin n=1 Tax=Amia calva TaxID=7924 RepID=Q5Y3D1_AMICA|nr:proenkephalin [Amia calva]MBN3304757.1 PENK protein [Amia calva]
MALAVRCPCWLLVLSACLILTVRADCGKDCTHCTYHPQGRQAEINTLTCTLECEGKLASAKSWDLCKEILQGKKGDISSEEDNIAIESVNQENDGHQLAKKYGGFMKRYGGFMKKTAELYNVEPEDENNGREILAKRYGGFMKKDAESGVDTVNLLKEILNAGGSDMESHGDHDGEIMKRYGGFMRSIKRSLDLEDGIKELQKRYGGFMRRVGRPEWKEDQKRYGGFLKRSRDDTAESNSEDMQDMEKRYGGFMGY